MSAAALTNAGAKIRFAAVYQIKHFWFTIRKFIYADLHFKRYV